MLKTIIKKIFSKENDGYKTVRTFNAWLLALAGAAAIFVACFSVVVILVFLVADKLSPMYKQNSMKVTQQSDESAATNTIVEKIVQGELEMISVKDHAGIIKLYKEQNIYSSEYSSSRTYKEKSTNSSVNILFVDVIKGTTKKLFDHYQFLISNIIDIKKFSDNKYSDTEYLALIIRNKDTNNDGFINSRDQKSLVLASNKGQKIKQVISFVDNISSIRRLDENTLMLMQQNKALTELVHINLNDFSIINKYTIDYK